MRAMYVYFRRVRLSTPGLLRCCPCRLRRTRLTKQGTEEPKSSLYRVPHQHKRCSAKKYCCSKILRAIRKRCPQNVRPSTFSAFNKSTACLQNRAIPKPPYPQYGRHLSLMAQGKTSNLRSIIRSDLKLSANDTL